MKIIRRLFLPFSDENFIKIELEVTWQKFVKNHGFILNIYKGKILVWKDFWPIVLYWKAMLMSEFTRIVHLIVFC
jgi:hypothetical protein